MELHDERTVADSVARLDDGAREELVELVGGVHVVACLDSLVDLTGRAPEHLAAVAPFHELYPGCPTVEAAGLAALRLPLELVTIAAPTGLWSEKPKVAALAFPRALALEPALRVSVLPAVVGWQQVECFGLPDALWTIVRSPGEQGKSKQTASRLRNAFGHSSPTSCAKQFLLNLHDGGRSRCQCLWKERYLLRLTELQFFAV